MPQGRLQHRGSGRRQVCATFRLRVSKPSPTWGRERHRQGEAPCGHRGSDVGALGPPRVPVPSFAGRPALLVNAPWSQRRRHHTSTPRPRRLLSESVSPHARGRPAPQPSSGHPLPRRRFPADVPLHPWPSPTSSGLRAPSPASRTPRLPSRLVPLRRKPPRSRPTSASVRHATVQQCRRRPSRGCRVPDARLSLRLVGLLPLRAWPFLQDLRSPGRPPSLRVSLPSGAPTLALPELRPHTGCGWRTFCSLRGDPASLGVLGRLRPPWGPAARLTHRSPRRRRAVDSGGPCSPGHGPRGARVCECRRATRAPRTLTRQDFLFGVRQVFVSLRKP